MTQEQDFLDGIKSQEKIITEDSSLVGDEAQPAVKTTVKNEDDGESPRNRREKRFVREMEEIRKKAQEDREARIRAEERAAAILELGRRADASDDPDEVKFYGDTPEGKFAKAFMDKKLQETEERAYRRALEEIKQEQEKSIFEEQKDSQVIDAGLAQVEERFNVDLSGDTAESKKLRNNYIDFLESLTNESFPDFVKSFELFQQINTKPREVTQRQKALADRSMSSTSTSGAPQERKFKTGREYIDYLQQINS